MDKVLFKKLLSYVNYDLPQSLIISTTNINLIENYSQNDFANIINTSMINDNRRINKYFNAVNSKLRLGGTFVGIAELNETRNLKILSDHRKIVAYIIIIFNFIFHRVSPKLKFTQKFYFYCTKGKRRSLSKAEILGRLICCGFEIVKCDELSDSFVFVVKKISTPSFDMNPSYSPIYKMSRIGKGGKRIRVYKFRTMHSYSEYLQEYLINNHGYNANGKILNDFRTTKYGRLLRKYWLDELPQIINVFKGEMGIFGVRPLSRARFDEFPLDLQEKRIKYRPGCIPPYVSLLMPDQFGNIEAERIYLEDLENNNTYYVNLKYTLRAIYNIVFGKIRSA
jgi:hypothetical protein